METEIAFPRDDMPEHLMLAWLYDIERLWAQALTCPDLEVTGKVRVVVRGLQGRQRAVTAEKKTRYYRASELVSARCDVAGRTLQLMTEIARLRRIAHYARLGQEPPAAPGAAASGKGP